MATSNQFPLPSPWVADGPNSKWIAPRADAGNNNAVGNYTYRTTFDLTGLNSWTAELHGAVGSDNAVTVMLNGATVAYSTGFTSLTPFTISNGFVAGVNTLDFVIYNAGTSPNPTGLRVELAGTAVPSSGSSAVLVTTYSYDRLGHVTGVYMPRSTDTQTRSFNYSGNLLMSATNPENGTVSYTYNSYNKVATRTDAKDQQVVYTYDGYARLTKVQRYPQGTANPEDGCQQENYYYDSNPFDSTYSQNVLGRLAAVQYMGGAAPNPTPGLPPVCNTSFTEMYSYSVPGGVTVKRLRVARTQIWYSDPSPYNTAQTMTIDLNAAFAYDNEGRMISEQYPLSGPNLGFGYDSMGRPYSITDTVANQAVIGSATYGPGGQLLSLSGRGYYGSFGTESRSYNAMLQLTGISSPGWNIQYNYSATQNNGKIVSQTDLVSGEQVSYTYDALNRLASAASNQSWSQSFSYDGFGNLTNVNAANAPGLGVVYDPATNRVPGYSDANGNTTNAGGYATVYDVENRMRNLAGSQAAVDYSYAPGNKRVWKGVWNGSAWTTDEVTFWSPSGQKLGTYALGTALGCNYYTDPCGAPFAPSFSVAQTGTDYYFGGRLIKNAGGWVYPDRLGSTVRTYPYGVERPSATTNGTEKFAGYFRDAETGLDYADQRYEQPGVGRFLTPDAVGQARLQDPGSWNRYIYVRGDPINRIDPSGNGDCNPESPQDCYCQIYSASDPHCSVLYWPSGAGPTSNQYATVFACFFLQPGCTSQIALQLQAQQSGGAQQAISEAGSRASDRIASADCASLFLAPEFDTPDARAALSQAFQNYVANNVRTLPVASSTAPANVPAFTTGANGYTYIVQSGAFFTGQLNGSALGGAFNGLSLSQDQELILIHEFLHFEGIVGPDSEGQQYKFPDGTVAVGSAGVSDQVRKHCFN